MVSEAPARGAGGRRLAQPIAAAVQPHVAADGATRPVGLEAERAGDGRGDVVARDHGRPLRVEPQVDADPVRGEVFPGRVGAEEEHRRATAPLQVRPDARERRQQLVVGDVEAGRGEADLREPLGVEEEAVNEDAMDIDVKLDAETKLELEIEKSRIREDAKLERAELGAKKRALQRHK